MKQHIILASVITALSLSSCSIFQPATNNTATPVPKQQTTSKPSTPATKTPAQTPSPVAEKPKPAGTKKKPDKSSSETKQSQNHAMAADEAKLRANLGCEWTIVKVGDKKISRDEDMPYLYLDTADGKLYGSNGCNVINGNFSVSGRKITFSNVLTTMRYCPDCDFDTDINAVIADGRTVNALLVNAGKETFLYFNASDGKSLLTLVRHGLKFLDGQWQVHTVNGKTIDDEEANIFFDLASLKVHGNTGCNYFNGEILLNPERADALSISGMGVTRMACPKGDQEREMLVALEETVAAVKGSDDTAILIGEGNKPLITLKRVQQEN